jgi:hypothetical protein
MVAKNEATALRIRSRLILSQILDAVWWWRDEYDPNVRAKMQGPALGRIPLASRVGSVPIIARPASMPGGMLIRQVA